MYKKLWKSLQEIALVDNLNQELRKELEGWIIQKKSKILKVNIFGMPPLKKSL